MLIKGALHTLNQMVNRLVNHLVKCVRVARSPDRRLKLTLTLTELHRPVTQMVSVVST